MDKLKGMHNKAKEDIQDAAEKQKEGHDTKEIDEATGEEGGDASLTVLDLKSKIMKKKKK